MKDVFAFLQEAQEEKKRESKAAHQQRRNFLLRFQRWSDRQSMDGSVSYGKCGYSIICEYCTDNIKGNPCARALSAFLKDTGFSVCIHTTRYEDIWTEEYFKEGKK